MNQNWERPRWPMIILRTPKGWTGPKEVDGKRTEGSWRSHQVPLAGLAENPAHLKLLEQWMRSYKPEELFEENGSFKTSLASLAPKGTRRMSANPHTNGGVLLRSRNFHGVVPEIGHAKFLRARHRRQPPPWPAV